ncbi:hypothetical protein Tco_1380251 [Tanacetum coccineum]
MMMGGKHSNDDVEEFARVNASNITVKVKGDPDAAKRYKRIYKCKEKGCDKEYDSFRLWAATGPATRTLEFYTMEIAGLSLKSLGGHMRKHRLGKLDINKAMVLRRPVDYMSSSSSDVSNLLSSKKALEFNLNMMPQEKQEE